MASPVAGAPPLSLKLECLQHSGSFKARGRVPQSPDPPCAGRRLRHRLRRQPRRGGRLCGAEARRSGAGVRAGDLHAGEDRPDPGLRRRGRRRRRDPTPRRRSFATPMSPRAARCRSTPTTRPRRSPAPGTVALEWEEDPRTPRPAAARHGARRGRRRRADRRRRRLVRRPGQGRRRRAGRFARAARGARGRPRRSTSRSSRSPPIRSARSGSANSNFAIAQRHRRRGRARARRGDRRSPAPPLARLSIVAEPGGAAAFAALASGAYRPERGERVGVLVCGANVDLAAFAKLVCSATEARDATAL